MTDIDKVESVDELDEKHDAERVNLRATLGHLTVEVDASRSFIRNDFLEVLRDLQELAVAAPGTTLANVYAESPADSSGEPRLDLTTGSIAAALNVRTGSELAVAAAAKLTLVDGRQRFSRRDLMAEMRTAGSYFKKTYSSNFSNYLNTLLKERRLIESSAGVFALAEATRREIQQSLE